MAGEKKGKDQITIELEGGKKIIMRRPMIADIQLAAKAASVNSGNDAMVFQSNMVTNLVKSMLVSIDGKTMGEVERGNLDAHLSINEYLAVQSVAQGFLEPTAIVSQTF